MVEVVIIENRFSLLTLRQLAAVILDSRLVGYLPII